MLLKKELRKILLVSLPMIMTPAFNMIFLILAARVVDVTAYGNLAYTITLASILIGFSDLGLRDYFLSKDGLPNKYAKSINLLFFSTVVFTLIAFAQLLFLASTPKMLFLFLAFLGEAYALGVLHKTIYHEYQSENNLTRFSELDSIIRIIPIVLKITILYSTHNLLFALLTGSACTLLLYGFWLSSLHITSKPDFTIAFRELQSVWLDWRNWGIYTISFVSFFLYFGADKLVVEKILGIEQLAIFSAAMAFISIGQIAVGVLWSLYMPRLSRGERLWSYKKFMTLMTGLGVLTTIAYQLFSYYIYENIYPEEYKDGIFILSTASVYFLFRFPNVIIEINYILDSKYQDFVKMRVLFGLVSITLNFTLLPIIGIVGSALSLVASEMLLMLGLLLRRRRPTC